VNGDQIGISTFASQSQNGPGLGGIREVNLAVPYVNQAMKIGGSTPQPLPSQTVVAGTPRARPTATAGAGNPQPIPNGNGPFGAIAFGTDVQNNQLVNEGTQFDSGTTKIIGVFDYQGMRNGLKWGAVWKLNGAVGLDQHNDYTWDSDASGTTGVSISLADGLPDGSYDLLLYVSNEVVQQGSFTIGSPASTPTAAVPSTPRPNQSGVSLKGQVVDADTGSGVPGAAILILKPGVDINSLTNDNLAQNTAAAGQADQDGFYLTAPAIQRGQSYTVIVAADNYQPQIFQDGLSIASNDPDVVEMQPIQLSTR